MGRPKKSEPRIRQLNISLSDTELAGICRRAKSVGMRTVHFGRTLLLADGARSGRTGEARDTTVERLIYGQLVRLGNNLNQLVRHLHRTGDPIPADLEPLLADIRQIISRSNAR